MKKRKIILILLPAILQLIAFALLVWICYITKQ